MNKLKIKATIIYTVDENHPDYKCMNEKQQHGVNSFSDTYVFDMYNPITNPYGYWTTGDSDQITEYMIRDLSLVAGGGYTTDHIHNLDFKFEQA